GYRITSKDVFECRTAARLAATARPTAPAAPAPGVPDRLALVPLAPDDVAALGRGAVVDDVLPLSPLQQGFLFHAGYDTAAPDVYVAQPSLLLQGPLDVAALKDAARALLRRHAGLRSAFRPTADGTVVQVVLDEVTPRWREVDLRPLAPEAADAEAATIMARERAARFDLAEAPLLRFVLIRLAEQTFRIVLTHHHIVLDGWSMPLVLGDLFALYEAGGDGSGLAAVPPHRAYPEWLAVQDRPAAEAAWRLSLAGLDQPTLLLPEDPARPTVPPERSRL
ncbi:condensation domain-containing protein, partial [Streptomyces sp. V4-01]|nr:condensation domain-containing protein [Streptomyces sp. V4-01]